MSKNSVNAQRPRASDRRIPYRAASTNASVDRRSHLSSCPYAGARRRRRDCRSVRGARL